MLYLEVDDVPTRVEELRADGVAIEAEPHVIFSHTDDTLGPAGHDEWMAFIRDSEGNLVGLVSHAPRAESLTDCRDRSPTRPWSCWSGPAARGSRPGPPQHYRQQEVVSSDALRAVVGSGEFDLDASADAFALLHQIVAGRAAPRAHRRRRHPRASTPDLRDRLPRAGPSRRNPLCRSAFRHARQPSCRARNCRSRPPGARPACSASSSQPSRASGWPCRARAGTRCATVVADSAARPAAPAPTDGATPGSDRAQALQWARCLRRVLPEVVLQVSRFPWGADPAGWLRSIALAADQHGFGGIALMDHLIQIPQVDRAWEPIPEPWVTLGLLAGLDTDLAARHAGLAGDLPRRRGSSRKPLPPLTSSRADGPSSGSGPGWWEREHLAFGLPFPSAGGAARPAGGVDRDDPCAVGQGHQGARRADASRCRRPRHTHGRWGDHRSSWAAPASGARCGSRPSYADACNLPSDLPTLERKLEVLRSALRRSRA